MKVAVDGAELHCASRGTGPAILVPSAIGTAPYLTQFAALAERFRVVVVDPRGAGRSTGDPSELEFDRMADDLDAVREALGAPRAILLGHSILGALAIESARRKPQSFSHAVAVGTPPFGDMARLAAASEAWFERHADAARREILRANLAALPADATPGQRLLAETPKRFFDPRHDAAPLLAGAEPRPAFFAHLFGVLTPGWDVLAEARPLAVPLLLAHGRHDATSPPDLWDGVVERLPTATRVTFERSGHQPFVEEPEAFVAALDGWLERTG